MLYGDSEGWKAISRPLGHNLAQARAVRNGWLSGDVLCSGYERRPIMASRPGKTHRQTTRCSERAQMHARCPATAVSTVGSQLFTLHWAAALPIEAAAAVVLSRWCTTEAPWRLWRSNAEMAVSGLRLSQAGGCDQPDHSHPSKGPPSCSSGSSGRHGHARSRLLQLMTIPSRQALPLPPAEPGAQNGR